MRFTMPGGSGSGGGSMIKKGSAAEKQKLMKLSGEDRYKLMTARKTAEITENMIMRKFNDPDNPKSSKAMKMIQAMVKSQGKAIVAKAENAIALKEKKRQEEIKRAKATAGLTAAQKAAEALKQKEAMTKFLNNFYNKNEDNKGWW
jgi:hypothetical protein